jgi:LmbE family N-acetylglucosaminyl deacetylase
VEAESEGTKAASIVGLEILELASHRVDNGTLQYSVGVMRELENIIFEKKIDLIFSHWQYDMNTDHAAAAKISIVAGRHVPTILQYRSNWYQPDRAFNGIYYIDISRQIGKKEECLKQYGSEVSNRGMRWVNSFLDQNRSFGFSIGASYAEVFEPVRVTV